MTETMNADERQNRDVRAWLELAIARHDGMPGRGGEVARMRLQLRTLKRDAHYKGWTGDGAPAGEVEAVVG